MSCLYRRRVRRRPGRRATSTTSTTSASSRQPLHDHDRDRTGDRPRRDRPRQRLRRARSRSPSPSPSTSTASPTRRPTPTRTGRCSSRPTRRLHEHLPAANHGRAFFPYWDDLRTDGGGDGIYMTVTGSAPNRTVYVEWRTTYFSGGGTAFEFVANENDQVLRTIYGTVSQAGASSTEGVQDTGAGIFDEYGCNGAGGAIDPGLAVIYTPGGGGPPPPPPPPPGGGVCSPQAATTAQHDSDDVEPRAAGRGRSAPRCRVISTAALLPPTAPMPTSPAATRSARHPEHALPLRPGCQQLVDAGADAGRVHHGLGRLPTGQRSLRLRWLRSCHRRQLGRDQDLRRRHQQLERRPEHAGRAQLHGLRLQPRQRQDLPRRRLQHRQRLTGTRPDLEFDPVAGTFTNRALLPHALGGAASGSSTATSTKRAAAMQATSRSTSPSTTTSQPTPGRRGRACPPRTTSRAALSSRICCGPRRWQPVRRSRVAAFTTQTAEAPDTTNQVTTYDPSTNSWASTQPQRGPLVHRGDDDWLWRRATTATTTSATSATSASARCLPHNVLIAYSDIGGPPDRSAGGHPCGARRPECRPVRRLQRDANAW